MCKYATFHRDEFQNPEAAFVLGVLIIIVNILIELNNLLNSLVQTTIKGVLSQFVAYNVLILIQDFYMKARKSFPVKAAVAEPILIVGDLKKVFGKKEEKKNEEDKDEN